MRSRWLDPMRLVAVLALIACAGCQGLIKDKSPLAGQTRLPAFPDPVPSPIASLQLPPSALFAAGPEELAEVHRRLTEALQTAGFDHWSVYAFKDGFALVTRWERIEQDGSPAADRFTARPTKRVRPGFDFEQHAQLLFYAPDGDYRLFVFTIVGTDPTKTASVPIDGDKVGAGDLPDEIAGQLAADRSAEAHVYLYRKRGEAKAEPLASSAVDAATHLTRAGIFDAAQLGGSASSPQ